MTQEIKPGNVVKLKSGGHKMTVEIISPSGIATVRWVPVDWEGKPFAPGMQREVIHVGCLVLV